MMAHPCSVVTVISGGMGSAKREQILPSRQLCLQQGFAGSRKGFRAKARSWHQKANELTIGQGSPEYMQFDWEHLDRRIF